MAWTLEHDSVEQTFEAWGMSNCLLRFEGFAASSLTCTIAGPMTAMVPWAFKDEVIVRRDGVVVFIGYAMPMLRSGAGNSERVLCRFNNAWWWLSQGTYTQDAWDAETLASFESAMVALFAEITPGPVDDGGGWTRRVISGEIAAVIAHCNTLHGGGLMQFGTCSGDGFDLSPVPQKIDNATHEAALMHCLRIVPDAVPMWDYSTTPPTLNFVQRSEATARSYSFADGAIQIGQEIERKNDLAVTGIRIVYQWVDSVGALQATVDAAGETSGSGVAIATVDLTGGESGGSIATPGLQESCVIVSEAIDLEDPEFWFKHGDTGASSADSIQIAKASLALAVDENADEHESLDGCDRWIISGAVPSWLKENHYRVGKCVGWLKITETIVDSEDSTVAAAKIDIRKVLITGIPLTDLSSNTYTRTLIAPSITSVGGAIMSSPPTGIAAALLSAWSQPQYEGSLSIARTECTEAARPGDVLNITSAPDHGAEWATMAAQIQSVSWDIDRGNTTINIGPARHLTLEEFAGLLRTFRIAAALDLDQKATGAITGNAETGVIAQDTAAISSAKSSVIGTGLERGVEVIEDGSGLTERPGVYTSVDVTGKSFNLNTTDLPSGAEARFRKVLLDDGAGSTIEAYILTTAAPTGI